MTYEEIIEALENNVIEILRVECEKAVGAPLTRSDIVERKKIDPALRSAFKEIMQECIDKIEKDGTMEKMMSGNFHHVDEGGDDVQSKSV